MPPTVFVVHGSHPCVTVLRALEIKGVRPRVIEWPPAAHAAAQTLLFGRRTVPGIRFEDGTRLTGSRAIVRAIEERWPTPPLVPRDPDLAARVTAAEGWGDHALQPVARRVLWAALQRTPDAVASFRQGSRLPLPDALLPALRPGMFLLERRLNRISDASVRADLRDLPERVAHVDALIAEGVLDGPDLNVADLQIAPTVALLATIADLAPALQDRPALALAGRVVPEQVGHVPAGALPSGWLAPLRRTAQPA